MIGEVMVIFPFRWQPALPEHHFGEDFGCRWRTGIIPGITVFLPLCLEYLLVVHQVEGKVTVPRWTIYLPEKMVVPSAWPQAHEMCSPVRFESRFLLLFLLLMALL